MSLRGGNAPRNDAGKQQKGETIMGSGKPKVPSYASTTAANPYATATVNKAGSSFQLNKFLTNMNSTVENTLPGLYNQLLNPSLDNATSQAKMNEFMKQLNSSSYQQFENNLDSLQQRGMLRSSAVNDMSNKLAQYQNSQIGSYANSLLADNVNDTTNLINTFLNQYQLGASIGFPTLDNAFISNQSVNSYNTWKYQQDLAAYNEQMRRYQQALKAAAQIAATIYGGPAGGAAAGAVLSKVGG